MKKAICKPLFMKERFVNLLNRNGIDAKLTDDGFIFSDKVFELHPALMPHWIYMNLEWLRSCKNV